MKRDFFGVVLVFFLLVGPVLLYGQGLPMVPMSRNDSALIVRRDSLSSALLSRGSQHEAARQLDQNAMLFWNHNYLREAESYFLRSREINERIGNQHGVAGINSNLAFIYADQGRYEEAYEFLELTLAVRRLEGEPVGIISTLINASVVLNQLHRYEASIEKLLEALTLAREENDEVQMRSVYGMLSETYQKAGDVKQSLYYYEYYRTFNEYVTSRAVHSVRDSLARQRLCEENLRLAHANQELELERERALSMARERELGSLAQEREQLSDSLSGQTAANRALRERVAYQELENNLLEAQRSRTVLWVMLLVVGVALLGVGVFFLLILLRDRSRHNAALREHNAIIESQSARIADQNRTLLDMNDLLERQKRDTVSSIEYGLQVQQAMLGHGDPLCEQFVDAFSVNRPLAIVSGDFYYSRLTPEGVRVLAVGDCTGHGIPGAFLTVYAHSVLERSLYDDRASSPDVVISALDEAFNVINVENSMGLHSCDIGICFFDFARREFLFSGARNGVLVCNPGKAPFLVRGSRRFLGQRDAEAFRGLEQEGVLLERVPMVEGQWIYLFSDGFRDQMDERGVRYSSVRLHGLLGELSGLSGSLQAERLHGALCEWQGEANQLDDILVVGVRTL